MSGVYQFVDPERKSHAQRFQELLNKDWKMMRDHLVQFQMEHPDMEDIVGPILYGVDRAKTAMAPDYERDDYEIGTSANRRFHWRADNGFRDKESVRNFAEEHPGLVIENEYLEVLSLKDFLDSI